MSQMTGWRTEPHGLGELLTLQARAEPEQAALTFEGETLTRIELDRRANRMARALAELGIGQDDFVCVVLPNGFMHHILTFAVWKLGATPLPLSAKLPDIELRAIVELGKPKLVIGPDPARLPGFRVIPGIRPEPSLSDAPLPERTARSWKAVTSGGSTGRPKIIVDAKPALLTAGEVNPLLKIEPDDIMLHPAPIYHNSTFAQTNWGLCWGAHIIEVAKFDPLQWLKLVERYKVTWAYLVPTMMSRIWNLPADVKANYDLSTLRVAIHMAAPCPAWVKQAWIDWLGPEKIWEVYAGSEGLGATLLSGQEWLDRPGTVGKPLGEVKIFDEDGNECAPGQIGEIFFKAPGGPGSTFRYIGAEMRRRNEWETLGDLGHRDEEGYLYLADRRTDMIVSGGANIYPAEIEAALEAHPAVATSAVVGLPHKDFGRVPHAIISLRPGATPPAAGPLETFLAERLARYKLPYTYEISGEPLRDDAGKMRRTALRDEREARAAAGEKFLPLRARLRG